MTWKSKKWCWKEQSSNTKMYKCICKKRDGSLFCHLNFSFAAKADRTRSWSKNRFQVSFRYIQFQTLSPIQLSLYTHSASSQQGSWIALCGLFVTGSFCSSDRQVWITWTQPERTTKQTNKQKTAQTLYACRRCRAYWSWALNHRWIHTELHQSRLSTDTRLGFVQ